jgi:carbon starvation protein
MFFIIVLWTVILDMLRVAWRHLNGLSVPPVTESAHEPSRLVENWVRD